MKTRRHRLVKMYGTKQSNTRGNIGTTSTTNKIAHQIHRIENWS